MTTTRPWKVLVLGGGYAGTMTANRLAGTRRSNVQVTLVNPSHEFVERIRLHEVAARPESESATRHTLRSLLHPSVRLRFGKATLIRPDERKVNGIDTASNVPWAETYDELVYALGSGEPFVSVPGVEEHAHSIASLDAARTLKKKLGSLAAGSSVLIVGGGPTAIELVTELAVARPRLRLTIATSSELGPTLSAKGRAYLASAKAMSNVRVMEDTAVAEVTDAGVITRSGADVPADCVVWAASFAVPSLARKSGLEVDRSGRLLVNDVMRAPQHPEILGAGDGCVITDPVGDTLRMACATAAPQGAHVAATIMAKLRGTTPEPFRLAYLSVAMSLGPGDGLVQPTRADDSPKDAVLKGLPGTWFNELINRYARLILTWERRKAGAYRWAKPPAAAGSQDV